jgi:hypothetical protein
MNLAGCSIPLTGGSGSFGNASTERNVRDWPDVALRIFW